MNAFRHSGIIIFVVALLTAGCASTATEKNTRALAARVSAPEGGRSYTILSGTAFALGTNINMAPEDGTTATQPAWNTGWVQRWS